jgi:hypothetical protein
MQYFTERGAGNSEEQRRIFMDERAKFIEGFIN